MAHELNDIFEKLRLLKENLIKLSYEKRTPERLSEKFKEATVVFNHYTDLIPIIQKQIDKKELSGESLLLIKSFSKRIKKIYSEIKEFCSKLHIRTPSDKSDSDSFGSTSDSLEKIKMAFNLKTALSLLPVVSDENSIRQLIDGIEYYNSLLENDQCKSSLISFVLKTRLSQAAKLRLQNNYLNVDDLLNDMRTILLPKKSATALQNKLHSTSQGQKSIEDYGRELSEIFMDLSIAQADGKMENLKILQPVCEKQAIKRFADGLRNRRLSTIIAARNFSNLKDAVQAAVDEEMTSTSQSNDFLTYTYNNNPVIGTHGRPYLKFRTARQYRGASSYNNYSRPVVHRGTFYRGRGRAYQNGPNPSTWYRGKYSQYRNRYNNYRGHKGTQRGANIRVLNESTNDESPIEQSKFFRE